ncbi:nuclear factor 7, ovary-like [Protopterus annectens]|uniref:nuclear factor 7, ovary-like n=1 Tax=Protopterus annectens TaxID=7888 RepID=UPI001CFA92B5|nr:nuclear factor 7, ovary-like [Protopterus annectens]
MTSKYTDMLDEVKYINNLFKERGYDHDMMLDINTYVISEQGKKYVPLLDLNMKQNSEMEDKTVSTTKNVNNTYNRACIIEFGPHSNYIKGIMNRNWHIFLTDQATGKTLTKKIKDEFQELYHFLKQEEQAILSQLMSEQDKVLEVHKRNISLLSQQQEKLQTLITESEEALKLQDALFLKAIRKINNSQHQSFQISVESPKLNLAEFQFPLQYLVWRKMRTLINPAHLNLNPNTANSFLILSEDQTSVRLGTKQDVSDNAERFDCYPAVLSIQGFFSGIHYWEVEVCDEDGWCIGVVKESVKRKEYIFASPENGYWTLARRNCSNYYAGISPVAIMQEVRRILVYLDYSAGQLSFYNADNMSHLYTYSAVLFIETIYPFFLTFNKCIKIISSVVTK